MYCIFVIVLYITNDELTGSHDHTTTHGPHTNDTRMFL